MLHSQSYPSCGQNEGLPILEQPSPIWPGEEQGDGGLRIKSSKGTPVLGLVDADDYTKSDGELKLRGQMCEDSRDPGYEHISSLGNG